MQSPERDASHTLQIETAAVPASCRYFVNCFDMRATTVGSDRWAYIFLQGAVLGILLDVVQMELFKAITAALTVGCGVTPAGNCLK